MLAFCWHNTCRLLDIHNQKMSWGLPSNLNTAKCCIFLLWDYPLPCPFITTPFVYKTTLIEVVKSTFQPSGPSFGNSFARRSSAVSTKALDVRAPGLERFASLQGLYVNVVMVLGVVVVVFVVVVLAVVAAVSGQLGPQCQFAHGREELQKVPRKHTCDFLTPALPLGERIRRDFRGWLYVLCSTVSVTSDKPNLLPFSGNLYLGSCHLFPKSMSGWRIIMINLPDNLLQTVWKQNSETGLQRFQHFKLHTRKIVGLLPLPEIITTRSTTVLVGGSLLTFTCHSCLEHPKLFACALIWFRCVYIDSGWFIPKCRCAARPLTYDAHRFVRGGGSGIWSVVTNA